MALLAAMLLLVVAASYALLSKLNAAASIAYQQQRSARALAEAKSALVGYAMTYAENHVGEPQGYLPCPDTDGDGTADSPCGATGLSVIGRLPWRTLNMESMRDSSGECIWYALSGNYKASANSKTALTSDADGLFDVQDAAGNVIIGDTNVKGRAVAVIFAPGPIVGTQVRGATAATRTECGSTNAADAVNNPANYLETIGGVNNATGAGNGGIAMPTAAVSRFVMSPPVRDASGAIAYNDLVEAVTPSDLTHVYTRMDIWAAERVRGCLARYAVTGAGRYPWAAVLDPAAAPDYDDDTGERFGRIPTILDDSVADAAAAGNPAMSAAWPSDPNDVTKTCFDEGAAQVNWSWWWWSQWKENVLYAVDSDFSPTGTAVATPPAATVDGAAAEVVILASGRSLTGQSRITNVLRGGVAQYLEAGNIPAAGTGAIPTGDEGFGNGTVSPTFNDVVCNQTDC